MKATKQDYIDYGKDRDAKYGFGIGAVGGLWLGGGIWGAAIGAVAGAVGGAMIGARYGEWQADRDGVNGGGRGEGGGDGGEGGDGCFVYGTVVLTDEGPIPIDLIERDAKVLSRNMVTGEVALTEVAHTFQTESADLVTLEVAEETIRCSPGHRFHTDHWVSADELAPGDRLLNRVGRRMAVRSVSKRAEVQPVFNLSVPGTGTYFVGRSELLVHNLKKQDPSGEAEGDVDNGDP